MASHIILLPPPQVTRGFSNWKDATLCFKRHETSACHRQAVEIVITLPKTTRDVGEQLSREHAVQKRNNRDALYISMSCARFLARQGLALRGDGTEKDGNFY